MVIFFWQFTLPWVPKNCTSEAGTLKLLKANVGGQLLHGLVYMGDNVATCHLKI